MRLSRVQILLGILLIVIALSVLALPYHPWGFMRDDFGFLAHAAEHAQNWAEFFKPHNVVDFVYPSSVTNPLSWSGSFYRPVQFIHFALEYLCFGTNSYAYLLWIVLMHAGIISILFFVGSKFFSPKRAFFVALAILLHPMLMLWMGCFTQQIYIIDVLYFLAITWFLKKFCDTNLWRWYAASCLLFFVALFAKETLITYPGWVFIGCLWYLYQRNQLKKWYSQIFPALKIASGYVLVGIAYLITRYMIFAGATDGSVKILGFSSWQAFVARQSERFFDLVTYVCNYLYVGMLPGGNWLRKGLLVGLIISLLVYPFIRKRQLQLLSFLGFSILAVTWPAWLLYYHTRYAYAGLVFLYFIYLFAIDFYLNKFTSFRRIAPLLAVGVISGLGYNAIKTQRIKNNILSTVTGAARELALETQGIDRPLIFVGLPHYWFASGAGQLVKLFYPQDKRQVAIDILLFGDEEFGPLKQHDVFIERRDDVVDISLSVDDNLTFLSHPREERSMKNIKLPRELLAGDAIVITWDYRRHGFRII